MSRLRAVIIEDEPLARDIVRDLLARDRDVTTVGEASSGVEGLKLIRALEPDLAFVDVEMPEMNGVAIVKALDPAERPEVVFITAYSEFATDAFDVEALDYVVKPFSDERFFAALGRVKSRIKQRKLSGLMKRAASEASEIGGSGRSQRKDESGYLESIPVRSGDRSRLLRARDLVWIESADYYARLHTARGSHLVRTSLATLEKRLNPRRFLRVHRGAIVNVDEVVAIEHLPKGAQLIVLSDGSRCRVSRSRKAAVDATLLPALS
jgi:two-component system LytT family response regulator